MLYNSFGYCCSQKSSVFNPYSPNVLYEGQMSCVKDNLKYKKYNKLGHDMKIITNHFCNYNALDLLTKCHSMLIIKIKKIKNSIVLYKGQMFR